MAIEDYECSGNAIPYAKIWINGTRIPLGDVDLYIRKEGNLAINRYVEAEFPSPYNGTDWLNLFETYTQDQKGYDTVRVDVYDVSTQTYHTEFYGAVTALRNSGSDNERFWTFEAQGPEFFFDRISASQHFLNASIKSILQYVSERIEEKIPLNVEANGTDKTLFVPESEQGGLLEILRNVPAPFAGAAGSNTTATNKTFKSNKHTLKDVIDWIQDKYNVRIWFIPRDGIAYLYGSKYPTYPVHIAGYVNRTQDLKNTLLQFTSPDAEGTFNFEDNAVNGDLQVINNDANTEIRPINTILVKGQAKKTLGEVGGFELNVGTDQYFEAKARHIPLYESAGNIELLAHPDQITDANTEQEVRNEARSLLKKRLDETTGGTIQTLVRAPINPHHTVIAKPTCDGSEATSVPPIPYEVNRVHHKLTTTDIPETKLNVGIRASFDDIEVIGSWKRDA